MPDDTLDDETADDLFVIGHLAAFTPEKGQLDALDALAELLPRHPRLRMILAGDGPLREDPITLGKVSALNGAAPNPDGFVAAVNAQDAGDQLSQFLS